MRRSILVPAALLFLSGLASGCAHQTFEPGVASPDRAPLVAETDESNETDASEGSDAYWSVDASGPADPNVISFEEEAGPVDVVAAPPKREDIPGFQLFGTGSTESEPGPRLTLPDDME